MDVERPEQVVIAKSAKGFGFERRYRVVGELMPFEVALVRGSELIPCGQCAGNGKGYHLLVSEGRFSDAVTCDRCEGRGELTRAMNHFYATGKSLVWSPEYEIEASGVWDIPGEDDQPQEAVFESSYGQPEEMIELGV